MPRTARTGLRAAALDAKTASPGTSGLRAGQYVVSDADKLAFARDGFVTLRGVMTDEEMARDIDPVYHSFIRGDIDVPGRDVCDMSGAVGRTRDEFTIYNVMLPRKYEPAWQGNRFEQRCEAIVRQLCGDNMTIDYDQILAKKPHSPDAIFAWHQDMAYWPDLGTDSATATCWLAVSDTCVENGCMGFVPGSHATRSVRRHAKVAQSRQESHVISTEVDEALERVVRVPLARGDITVHNEFVVHGSGPNVSDSWRHGYVLAFRRSETVARERALGFTHSHNDESARMAQ